MLLTKPGDKNVVKKVKDAIRQNLSIRYQEEDIETMLSVAMYLDPRFKKGPILTTERKASVKSYLKYELEILVLKERRSQQGAEVTEVIRVEEEQETRPTSPKRTKLEKFFGNYFQSTSGEVSASEAAERELQRYELEEPLSLKSKKPLL